MKTTKQIKNETVYVRQKHDLIHPYRMIGMSIINDERLSIIELGLMLKALSNADEFSFVASYNQKKSGIGQVSYHKATKHLQELGYLIKSPITGGGWKWVIIESKEQIERFIELEWITYNAKQKTWKVVNSKLFSSQAPDIVRNSDIPNTEIPNSDSPAADFPNTDIRSRDLTGKTINKEIRNNGTSDEQIKNPEREKYNNSTKRDSQALAEAISKIDKKNETGIGAGTGEISTGNRDGIKYKLFNQENSQKVSNLYQRNSHQMKGLTLPQLEKLFVISVLFRLDNERIKMPNNFEELQQYTSRINFQGFSSIMNRYKFDNDNSIRIIDKLVEPYSSDYVTDQVDFSSAFNG